MAKKIPERVVHAWGGITQRIEMVRYNKGGKWVLEWDDGYKMPMESIEEAATRSVALWYKHNGTVNFDQPGGTVFSRLVRHKVETIEAERQEELARQMPQAVELLTEFLPQASRAEKCGVKRAIEVLTHGPS